MNCLDSFNPYFTGLPILITNPFFFIAIDFSCFNPYFTGLPILINYVYKSSNDLNSFNPYFTGLPILIGSAFHWTPQNFLVSILILLDYLFLLRKILSMIQKMKKFQSLFYWITYSYITKADIYQHGYGSFQSLFYWITYSYKCLET